jgi:uncharacterized protein
MSHKNHTGKREQLNNSYNHLVTSLGMVNELTGGAKLSGYGTIDHANNFGLISLNRITLTFMFTGNGIFQNAIQVPIMDALSKGVEIESHECGQDEIDKVLEWMEGADVAFDSITGQETDLWTTILNAKTWDRLYGGGGIVINTDQDPEKPFNINEITPNSKIRFYDVDRWQLTTFQSAFDDIENKYSGMEQDEYFWLYGQKIHRSRCIVSRGKKAPSYVRRMLKGWGMSVAESMIRDMNNYLKTDEVLYEILDESKIDVYTIKNLANKLLTTGGANKVRERVQQVNMIKSYLNAIMLDAEDKYEQKTMNFSGLAEIKRENRIGMAGAAHMPVTKLFGISAAGFNSGEDDIENYNSFVESEIRSKLKPMIRKILSIGFQFLFGYVPSFKIKFPSLRILSSVDEETIKASKQARILAGYEAELIPAPKAIEMMKKEGLITIDIDENTIPIKSEKPNGDLSTRQGQLAMPKEIKLTRSKATFENIMSKAV